MSVLKGALPGLLAAAVAGGALAQQAAPAVGDPAQGERVFAKCRACHQIGEGAHAFVGPELGCVPDELAHCAVSWRWMMRTTTEMKNMKRERLGGLINTYRKTYHMEMGLIY